MPRLLTAVILSTLVVVLSAACRTTESPDSGMEKQQKHLSEPASQTLLRGRTWRLLEFAGEPVTAVEQTLSFGADNNKLSGNAGCNSYFGRYQLAAGELTVGPLGASKKLCERAVMHYETRFFDALGTVSRAELVGDELWLYSPDLTAPLRFGPIGAP